FSKPERLSCENGRLSGSAQTRNSVLSTESAAASSRATLRQRKYMQHAAFHGVFRQVLHRVDEAERRRAVARVDLAGDHDARPAADAGENGDVLLSVRSAVAHRLAAHPRARPEAPHARAGSRIARRD